MGYVILDLEFNNLGDITKFYPNFYNDYTNLNNSECPNEIIEIGAVKLDKFLKEIATIKIYVKPSIYPFINPKITDITGISEKVLLEEGLEFKEAIKMLGDFVGDDDIVCSWAKDDVAEIIRNSNYHGINTVSWIKNYIDIQEYCTTVLGEKKSISLKNALERLSIKKDDSKLHDALNDSIYTAEVFRRIYNFKVLKNYIVDDILNMPAIIIKNCDDLEIDNSKLDLYCPKCKSQLNIEYPIKLFNWRFITVSNCHKCKSKILHEIVIKKTLSGDKVYKNNRSIINEEQYIDLSYRLDNIV